MTNFPVTALLSVACFPVDFCKSVHKINRKIKAIRQGQATCVGGEQESAPKSMGPIWDFFFFPKWQHLPSLITSPWARTGLCRGDLLFKRQKSDFIQNKTGFETQLQDSYKLVALPVAYSICWACLLTAWTCARACQHNFAGVREANRPDTSCGVDHWTWSSR